MSESWALSLAESSVHVHLLAICLRLAPDWRWSSCWESIFNDLCMDGLVQMGIGFDGDVIDNQGGNLSEHKFPWPVSVVDLASLDE